MNIFVDGRKTRAPIFSPNPPFEFVSEGKRSLLRWLHPVGQCKSLKSIGVIPNRRSKAFESCVAVE